MNVKTLEQIRKNYINSYTKFPTIFSEFGMFVNENIFELISPQGYFQNIDYLDESRSDWEPFYHIFNLTLLCENFINNNTVPAQKNKLKTAILRGLDYWLENDYANGNWWYNQVGVPLYMSSVLMFMRDELSDKQLSLGIANIERYKQQYKTHDVTGQNKAWLAKIQMMHGIIIDDDVIFAEGRNLFLETLTVNNYGDGIQSDNCFHQHGPMMQFGTYGLSFAVDTVRWAHFLKGTSVDFPEEQLLLLKSYLINGLRWIIWKDYIDPSVCGRGLFEDVQKRKACVLKQLMEVFSGITGHEYKKCLGANYFWRSDYMIYRTEKYYFSVKMTSTRTIGAETCNGESIKSKHQGDGVTILMQRGNEYNNIYPLWNWRQLPGITAIQDNSSLLLGPIHSKDNFLNKSAFAGGIAAGKYGLASFCLNHSNLKAQKSYFCFPEMILCQGSGIYAKSNQRTTTCINQSLLNGKIIVGDQKNNWTLPQGIHKLENISYVHHDNTLYIFLDNQSLEIYNTKVTSCWSNIFAKCSSEPVTKSIFKLLVDHKKNTSNGKYAYAILPNVKSSEISITLKQFQTNVIENSLRIHAVVDKSKQCCMLSFFKSGEINIPEICSLKVDTACTMIIECNNDLLSLIISDPTQAHESIDIEISRNFQGKGTKYIDSKHKTLLKCQLPDNAKTGQSVKYVLKLNRAHQGCKILAHNKNK